MKTKRIVALALAGALALGAVTPAFAEEGKKVTATTTKEELTKKTAEAYNKVRNAQKKVVDDLTKKKSDLEKDVQKKREADQAALTAVTKKQAEIDVQNIKIEAQDKKIADKQDELNDTLDLMHDEIVKLGAIKNLYADKFLGSDKEYEDAIEARQKVVAEEMTKAGKSAAEIKAATTDWPSTEKTDAKVAALREARVLYNASYKDLVVTAATQTHDFQNLKKEKGDLQAVLEKLQEELKTLTAKQKATNLAYGTAKKDLEVTNDTLLKEQVVLKRIEEVGKYLTDQAVKNEVDPKIAEMANKDEVFFILYYLENVRGLKISAETLKALNLDEATIKAYEDVLADEGSVAPAESSQEEESKKPDESKPNEEKPGTSEETPAPVVPGNKDNTATDNKDNKDNKKDNKKATKKSKKAPKTGDIAVLAYAGTAVLAAGAYVASKKRK